MSGYFCIEFTYFMLKGKILLDYKNLFSPKEYGKNDKIILKHFQQLNRWKIYIALFLISIENLRILKLSYIFQKKVLSSMRSKYKSED